LQLIKVSFSSRELGFGDFWGWTYSTVCVDEEAENEDWEIVIHSRGACESAENCSANEYHWDEIFTDHFMIFFLNFEIG
jgi:hypothetical protein